MKIGVFDLNAQLCNQNVGGNFGVLILPPGRLFLLISKGITFLAWRPTLWKKMLETVREKLIKLTRLEITHVPTIFLTTLIFVTFITHLQQFSSV